METADDAYVQLCNVPLLVMHQLCMTLLSPVNSDDGSWHICTDAFRMTRTISSEGLGMDGV